MPLMFGCFPPPAAHLPRPPTTTSTSNLHLHRRKAVKMQYFRSRRSSKIEILQNAINFAPFPLRLR